MLSYQHIYHAGNAADVHKHALLCAMLNYLVQKDKPLCYIETHAGRGLYDLDADEALKTGEAGQGILRLADRFPKDHPYMHRLAEVQARFGPTAYPGSPLLAALTLRDMDRMHLAELHPRENAALHTALDPWGAHIRAEDGFAMAQAVCPPRPRRGMMLVDPSYEMKEDYDLIPDVFAAINRKWNVGILALWYPILVSDAHRPMLRRLAQTFPDALRHEVSFGTAAPTHRLRGSGMFVVNPPYGLDGQAAHLSSLFANPPS
jgi:23S rRNA (adenine2030-N6)-methyltransferase